MLSLQQMSRDRKSGEIIENTIKLIEKKDLSPETAAALPTSPVHLKVKCILPSEDTDRGAICAHWEHNASIKTVQQRRGVGEGQRGRPHPIPQTNWTEVCRTESDRHTLLLLTVRHSAPAGPC